MYQLFQVRHCSLGTTCQTVLTLRQFHGDDGARELRLFSFGQYHCLPLRNLRLLAVPVREEVRQVQGPQRSLAQQDGHLGWDRSLHWT